ncbi:MAG: hypothetical protein FWC50_13725, partial [Planctomycetaceae bacterium]|nr:hypothetical protein [Planctomycetaceae bacterium]
NIPWFQKARTMLEWRRLPCEEQRDKPKDTLWPESEFVPVLGANHIDNKDGVLGFLVIGETGAHGSQLNNEREDTVIEDAFDAANHVFALFRRLDINRGFPKVDPHIGPAGGSSVSLPAMIAALGRILGAVWPDDIVSTGGFDGKLLIPVGSLPAKIKVAKRFGYKRLIVVEGQKEFPPDHGMEIIEVKSDPLLAMFDLLKLAKNDEISHERLAGLLSNYVEARLRSVPAEVKATVTPYLDEKNTPLVRLVANDVLCRIALHAGDTKTANEYSSAADKLENDMEVWPNEPWLANCLMNIRKGSKSILYIDLGLWGNDEPIHKKVDDLIEKLEPEPGPLDINKCYTALTLRNTRARRLRYVARMENKPELLEEAWNDLIHFYENWDTISKRMLERQDNKKGLFERQRNQCLDVLVDAIDLQGKLPNWENVCNFLDVVRERGFVLDTKKCKDAFDLVAKIHLWIIEGKQLDESETRNVFEDANAYYANKKGHPNFLPFELLLRYNFLRNEDQRRRALDQLAVAPHLRETGILTLLALRTRAVFAKNEMMNMTPLLDKVEDLLSDPDTLIERCPY